MNQAENSASGWLGGKAAALARLGGIPSLRGRAGSASGVR